MYFFYIDESGNTRVALYGRILAVLAPNNVRLFCYGIHKQSHAELAKRTGQPPDHPHHIAFKRLVHGIDNWLGDQSSQSLSQGGEPTVGLLIADEYREMRAHLICEFAEWRSHERADPHARRPTPRSLISG